MATIKSYTDLKQSRKLAEILPIESADMVYLRCYFEDEGEYSILVGSYHEGYTEREDGTIVPVFDEHIPAWSLAALLAVLPKNLNIGRPSLESNYKGYYWIQYYDEFMKSNNYRTECFSNPVDACYEMIIKLNELNLL